MANMNFGVNILPKANNTYTLGNSDYKWNIFANTLNGTSVSTLLSNMITDIQINETSIINNGIANIPIMSNNKFGVAKTNGSFGISISNDGTLITSRAQVSEIKAASNVYRPITPDYQHYSVFYGLAKAAGDSTQSASSNAVGTYTNSAKAAIQNMLAVAPTNNPIFTGSISMGRAADTTVGSYSVALGYNNIVTGDLATALGAANASMGDYSMTINYSNAAMGIFSFAGGLYNNSHGIASYSFGINAVNDIPTYTVWTASTSYSVGDNIVNPDDNHMYTCITANSDSSFNASKWSPLVKSTFIERIGNGIVDITNGTKGVSSNARALDWQGNEYLNGDLYVNCNADSTGGTKVATLSDIPSTMVGATSSVAGTSGLVPAPATTDVDKFLAGDGTYKSGGLPMVILSYGSSTWNDFINAYNNNVIVYCRASSNSNPGTGSQTRMAFMTYVNNATTPTNVEFQYYRSVNTHSATQMGDQVFVYKLDKTSGWSVTTREASIKQIKADTGTTLGVSWSNNVVTLTNTMTANDMPMSSSDATTTKSAIDTINTKLGSTTMGTTATTVTGAIAEHENDISTLNSKLKATRYYLEGQASGITQNGHYIVDESTRTVRIYLSVRSSTDITTATVLGNIPAQFRPSANAGLPAMLVNNSGVTIAYFAAINAKNGNITQGAGSTFREVIAFGEYTY